MAKYRDWAGEFLDENLESCENAQIAASHRGAPNTARALGARGVEIMMESLPAAIDREQLRSDLLAVEGTEEVHDLRVWCLASQQFALAAHAVI